MYFDADQSNLVIDLSQLESSVDGLSGTYNIEVTARNLNNATE